MSKPVRTAVFPVAGRGTRFLPAPKAIPKEMLPIVDKPLIQFAVEEALAAGATRMVFVTHATKRAIEDHFDQDTELERALEDAGKLDILTTVRDVLPKNASCVFIRQGEPLGLGSWFLADPPLLSKPPRGIPLGAATVRRCTSPSSASVSRLSPSLPTHAFCGPRRPTRRASPPSITALRVAKDSCC